MNNERKGYDSQEALQRRDEVNFQYVECGDMILLVTGNNRYLFDILYPANEEEKFGRAVGILHDDNFKGIYGLEKMDGVIFGGSVDRHGDILWKDYLRVGNRVQFYLPNGDSLTTQRIRRIAVMRR